MSRSAAFQCRQEKPLIIQISSSPAVVVGNESQSHDALISSVTRALPNTRVAVFLQVSATSNPPPTKSWKWYGP